MVKRKISGQTVAIIVLAILLIIAIVFGGVFAYYSASSSKITGKIVMANLTIVMESNSGGSDKSEIVISNGVNVVPGQPLVNTPLLVRNLSHTNIYLIVVYEINASKFNTTPIADNYEESVLGLGVEYINSVYPANNDNTSVSNTEWVDYVFNGEEEGRLYRCLVSVVDHGKTGENDNGIVVIGENRLSLSSAMGNEYQNANISFTFQAYAIRATDIDEELNRGMTTEEKCEVIVSAIYSGQDHSFLNISVTN